MEQSDSELRPNKRKLQDAIQSLDDAVAGTVDRPSPPKRQNTVRSLYTTLSRHGIKTRKEEGSASGDPSLTRPVDLSKTPRLAAILARAGTKTRKVLPFPRRPSTTSTSEYRPSSTASFLSRLETYKLSTYSNKPPEIDAVSAAKCGWVNEGKDRLLCGICGASWVVVGRDKMNRDAANALVKKQQSQLVENHKDGCPWKTRQCDPDVYRIQMSSPAAMAKEIKFRALQLEPMLENIQIKHPLLSSQVQSLVKIIASVSVDDMQFSVEVPGAEPVLSESARHSPPEPSQSSIIAALFGWSIAPPIPLPSKATPRPDTPAHSRASSVAPTAPSTPRRPSSSTQKAVQPLTPRLTSSSSPALARITSNVLHTPRATPSPEHQPALLYCSLCHRRLGLWAYGTVQSSPAPAAATSTPRHVDVLREHRPYCPYVTRSATVPALPVPYNHSAINASTTSLASVTTITPVSGGPVEGWRAVSLVVLRHRMSQRHWENMLNGVARRAEGNGDINQDQSIPEETDPVDAMIADVKKKGARELLNYVKGLLR